MAKKTKKTQRVDVDQATIDRFTSGYVFSNMIAPDGTRQTDANGNPVKNAKKATKKKK